VNLGSSNFLFYHSYVALPTFAEEVPPPEQSGRDEDYRVYLRAMVGYHKHYDASVDCVLDVVGLEWEELRLPTQRHHHVGLA